MENYKITQNEINSNNVKSAPDTVIAEGGTSVESVKNIFDKLPELIATRFNGFVDAVIAKFTNYYTKTETDNAIDAKVIDIGAGDMAKAVYDADGDGIVDNAENGVFDYVQNASVLTGYGTNGKFKATATATYNAFTINGESYAVKAGEETEIELVNGVWYSFILDDSLKTINFKTGGGVSNSKLALATATAADVLNGKTFYSGDKVLKTGANTNNTFNFTTLGTPTYSATTGTALATKLCTVNENAINAIGINASSWGSGTYTFPNSINVVNYTSLKIYFMLNVNEVHTGGDQRGITIGGVSTPITNHSMSLMHEIDVSSIDEFTFAFVLGGHANDLTAITIYKIELT